MSEAFAPQHFVGPMGSEFWRIAVPPDIVPVLAERVDWNRLGRRVMIDAAGGIIGWMNPSGPHEDYADAADKTVERAARLLGKTAKAKRCTRWKRPDDPINTGLESDASFYVGVNAERWLAARRQGGAEAAASFEAANPPDLVAEIEVTHFNGDKPGRYAALGVPEMWLVSRKSLDRAVEVEILDLRTPDGPRPVAESPALPCLEAATLSEAFELAINVRYEELEELLAATLAPAPQDSGPSTGF
ncbi:MAG: Uma2 family endonuclease [Albidovulum sp.]|nr:Uma2 family endonuclease [Albidovulum sp.]